jgi:hypothetical protein
MFGGRASTKRVVPPRADKDKLIRCGPHKDRQCRSYTVETVKEGGSWRKHQKGQYLSDNPSSAALKAVKRLLQHSRSNTVMFTLRETTRGVYTRDGERHMTWCAGRKVRLAHPRVVQLKGKQITIEYDYVARVYGTQAELERAGSPAGSPRRSPSAGRR